MKLERTFMSFILEHQNKRGRTLNFAILMESILTAARYIQYYYQVAALQKNLGEAGETNVQGESVMRMDLLANQIVMHYLNESRQCIEATSEELSDEVLMHDSGRYFIYFDPLDGSSNVKHGLPVGFLFGVAKRNLEGEEDYHLRTGDEYIAAGMFLIPTGAFTFALKESGAWKFILDEAGIYIRPERLYLPEAKNGWELSYNASNVHTFADRVQKWIAANAKKYAFRYSGSLAVDFHRLLKNGGLFMYPAIVNHPIPGKNRPEGKLRLMYECSVVSFIAREAGGLAVDERGRNVLDIQPQHRHQRASLFVGNAELVKEVKGVLTPSL